MHPARQQLSILCRGAEEIIPLEEFERKLERSVSTGRPLVVKMGFDATAPELHVGHAVGLRKLRDFQRLGHDVVFLIGDFTGAIGDPSGRSEMRRRLTREEVQANARSYEDQVFGILDRSCTRIEFNSRWCEPMRFAEVLDLTARYTVARLLERDDFRKRWESQRPISLIEFMYPLVQAYDSVALHADIELGGTDQKFNLLVARDIQREFGQEPQVVMTLPLLPGTDGVEKMSKSLGNHIGIADAPDVMFGKVMSIPDAVLPLYLRLVGEFEPELLRDRLAALEHGDVNPSHVKRELGRDVVRQYHDADAARAAEEAFDRVFVHHDAPAEMADLVVHEQRLGIVEAIVRAGLAASNGEARRLLRQGAVELDGVRIADERIQLDAASVGEGVLRVGKRRFVRLRFA